VAATYTESPDPDLERLLREGLDELGLASGASADLPRELARLAQLLHVWSRRISLTGHRSAEAIARRLVLDALALERRLPSETESLADLGAGAGFPGLPIALVRPGSSISLVESRERRIHFQRAAIRVLGLGRRVKPLLGRAEALEPQPHAIAVAQAMGAPDQAARWLVPWVEPDGMLVIPGGENAPSVGTVAGLGAPEVVAYRVPLGGPARTLWMARRIG